MTEVKRVESEKSCEEHRFREFRCIRHEVPIDKVMDSMLGSMQIKVHIQLV